MIFTALEAINRGVDEKGRIVHKAVRRFHATPLSFIHSPPGNDIKIQFLKMQTLAMFT